MTIRGWDTALASMIALIVLFVLRRHPTLQIPNSLTPENILHVNHTNVFATHRIVRIADYHDDNMPTIKITHNSDGFPGMVEKFTYWQIEDDSYKTALDSYDNTKNVKIDLPWIPGRNWQDKLSFPHLTAIQATIEKACVSKRLADALTA